MIKYLVISILIYLGALFTKPLSFGEPSQDITASFYKPFPYQDYNLGMSYAIADYLWVEVMVRIDEAIAKDENGLSWQYYYYDLITDIITDYRMAYRFGGETLSVLIGDKEGSRRIFEKGIQAFPNYWPIQYSAAYHYLEELDEPKRAAELLLLAHKNGGPDWFVSLAGKLYSKAGRRQLAIQTLQDYLKRFPEGGSRQIVENRLKKLLTSP